MTPSVNGKLLVYFVKFNKFNKHVPYCMRDSNIIRVCPQDDSSLFGLIDVKLFYINIILFEGNKLRQNTLSGRGCAPRALLGSTNVLDSVVMQATVCNISDDIEDNLTSSGGTASTPHRTK